VGPPVLPLGGGLGARHRQATLPACGDRFG
jgi:hypothetical protein